MPWGLSVEIQRVNSRRSALPGNGGSPPSPSCSAQTILAVTVLLSYPVEDLSHRISFPARPLVPPVMEPRRPDAHQDSAPRLANLEIVPHCDSPARRLLSSEGRAFPALGLVREGCEFANRCGLVGQRELSVVKATQHFVFFKSVDQHVQQRGVLGLL